MATTTIQPSSSSSPFIPSQQSISNPFYHPTLSRRFHLHSILTTSNHFFPPRSISASRSDQTASPPSPPASPIRFAFTGGGSGGHIYPAIAIADELRNLSPDSNFLFIGTSSGLESKAVPSAGYDFATIPASRLSRPILSLQNLLMPYHLLRAIAAAWQILRRFKPDIVIGTGGYVAAPVYIAAAISGTRIGIQEQNAFPGISNKIGSPFAEKVFLAFRACMKYFPDEKCYVYGNPVRVSLRRYVEKAVARAHFFPKDMDIGDEGVKVVLVLGGSQGASTVNVAVLETYCDMLLKDGKRYLIWQTGKDGFREMERLVKKHRRLLLTPFLQGMDLAYAAADVVVSRAGAMTCTEILITGKPSILIPSPFVAEDHQTNNACIMSDIAGSKILTEDELNSTSLATTIDEVLGNENLMKEMSEKALKSALPNAAINIAESILSLVSIHDQK